MVESLHDFVIAQLQAAKGQWPRIARESSVPYKTLQKIADGTTSDPGVSHIDRLARYFREHKSN